MKKFAALTVAVTLGLWGFGTSNLQAAAGNTNALLITFSIAGAFQNTVTVTNNDVVTTTLSKTSVKLDNQYILNLLQAEFSTTFPAGAQLAYNLTGDSGFHVLDSSGNSVLDVSTNPLDSSYGFGLSNAVAGAAAPTLINGSIVEHLATSNTTEVITALEPDEGIYFYDSHGNNFHIDGLLTLKANVTAVGSATTYNTVSFTIVGSGGGTFFNPGTGKYETGVFNKVKVSAKGAGIIQ